MHHPILLRNGRSFSGINKTTAYEPDAQNYIKFEFGSSWLQEKYNAMEWFVSGASVHQTLTDMAKDLIFHSDVEDNLGEFIADGGQMKIDRLESADMSYNSTDITITVNRTYLEKIIRNFDIARLASDFSHETTHHMQIKKLKQSVGHSQCEFYSKYDNKSWQMEYISREVGELYKRIISHFEAGGDPWMDLKIQHPIMANHLANELNKKQIVPGKKIPKDLYPAVGNLAILGFCFFNYRNEFFAKIDIYRKALFKDMKNNPNYTPGEKSIKGSEVLKYMEVEHSFSEDILESLFLIQQDDRRLRNFPNTHNLAIAQEQNIPLIEKLLNESFGYGIKKKENQRAIFHDFTNDEVELFSKTVRPLQNNNVHTNIADFKQKPSGFFARMVYNIKPASEHTKQLKKTIKNIKDAFKNANEGAYTENIAMMIDIIANNKNDPYIIDELCKFSKVLAFGGLGAKNEEKKILDSLLKDATKQIVKEIIKNDIMSDENKMIVLKQINQDIFLANTDGEAIAPYKKGVLEAFNETGKSLASKEARAFISLCEKDSRDLQSPALASMPFAFENKEEAEKTLDDILNDKIEPFPLLLLYLKTMAKQFYSEPDLYIKSTNIMKDICRSKPLYFMSSIKEPPSDADILVLKKFDYDRDDLFSHIAEKMNQNRANPYSQDERFSPENLAMVAHSKKYPQEYSDIERLKSMNSDFERKYNEIVHKTNPIKLKDSWRL